MQRKRYSEEQITFALRQHESGTPVSDIVRKMGIAEQAGVRREVGLDLLADPQLGDYLLIHAGFAIEKNGDVPEFARIEALATASRRENVAEVVTAQE